MMNRRGFLNKFLKGATAAVVAVPLLIPKEKSTDEIIDEAIAICDPSTAPFSGPRDIAAEWKADDLIHNIDPIDSPLFAKGGLPDVVDEFKAEVERKARAISQDIERKLWPEGYSLETNDINDWVDAQSFSRASIEAACGQNPSFFPEGSRDRITALGAEAVKRSAAAFDVECGSSLA